MFQMRNEEGEKAAETETFGLARSSVDSASGVVAGAAPSATPECLPARSPLSLLPRTTLTGAIAANRARISGPPSA